MRHANHGGVMKLASQFLGILAAFYASAATAQNDNRQMCPFNTQAATEIPELPCVVVLIDTYNKSARFLRNKCGGVMVAEIEIAANGQPAKTIQLLLDANEAGAFPSGVPADATVKITSQAPVNPYDQYIDGELSSMLEYTEEADPEDPTKNVKITFTSKSQIPVYVSGRVDHPHQPTNLIQLCTFQKVIWGSSFSFVLPRKKRPTELFQVRKAYKEGP
jgi:hypothetical protein